MSDVQAELAALRESIVAARAMPMSASAVVNRAEVLAAIDRITEGLAVATQEAAAVLAERDRVIADAQAEAREIVRLAGLERDGLVSDTEVFRLATRKAEEMRAEAERESEQLRRDADGYIEQRFANFEHALDRTLVEVRRGIANLSGRSAFNDDEDAADMFSDVPTDSGFGPGGKRSAARRDSGEGVLLPRPDAG
ncbi:hypothetical protein [Nocardioides sp. AE5]|uniref:hypothetical protein n=1 Tax=Nocardioides sp. AE5 TaxID=2962573 RepID=UPI0028811E30|nr:hypothetical protein [Nocardioides sp. AE5]MDT0202908.1 hypothetical protein [Nocardioides sp. AE5]